MSLSESIRTFFSDTAQRLSQTADSNKVIYAGAADPSEPTKTNGFEFGFYMAGPDQSEALWMPGFASDKKVIQQLKDLAIGQTFQITAESSWGGLGTRVHSIKRDTATPLKTIPADKPVVLKL